MKYFEFMSSEKSSEKLSEKSNEKSSEKSAKKSSKNQLKIILPSGSYSSLSQSVTFVCFLFIASHIGFPLVALTSKFL